MLELVGRFGFNTRGSVELRLSEKFGMADGVESEVDAIYSLPITVHELLNVDIRLATQVFQKTRVSPYDCAHAAIMRRTGLRLIVSADSRHFDHVPGLKRIDPVEDPGQTRVT